MAHSLSARKRVRQNEKQRLRNRSRRSGLKSKVRKLTDALGAADVQTSEQQLRVVAGQLDREANRGLIHRNAAARKKSRLARRLNQLKRTGAKS